MRIQLLASASQDLLDGYRFYEKQAEGVGLSRYTLPDIDLVISGGIHPVHFGKYHRLLSKRFPFAVYYRVEDQSARAVLDCRRSPAWIRKKLGPST